MPGGEGFFCRSASPIGTGSLLADTVSAADESRAGGSVVDEGIVGEDVAGEGVVGEDVAGEDVAVGIASAL